MNQFNHVRQSGLRMQDIHVLNPYDFQHGGSVLNRHVNIPAKLLPKGDVDTVLIRAQPGEIVIPKPFTRKVANFLRQENIKLPNLK